jgi:hypothetical protein
MILCFFLIDSVVNFHSWIIYRAVEWGLIKGLLMALEGILVSDLQFADGASYFV